MRINTTHMIFFMIAMVSFSSGAATIFNSSFEAGEQRIDPPPPPNSTNLIAIADVHDPTKLSLAGGYNAQNMLKNPNFETDSDWQFSCEKATTFSTEEKTSGNRSLKIHDKSDSCRGMFDDTLDYAISQSGIALAPDTPFYTVTFDLYVNERIETLGGNQTIQVFIDDKDHVKNDIFVSDLNFTFYDTLNSGWNPVQFVLNLEEIKSRLDNPNQLKNLNFTIKIGGLSATEHVLHLDNLRLSKGRIDDFNRSPMPTDLRNSKERIAILAELDGKRYAGTMMVGGKDAKLYKAASGSFFTHPVFFGKHLTVGERYLTHKLPNDGEPPAGTTRFPMFSIAVRGYEPSGKEDTNSPIFTFLGESGLLNSDLSTRKFGLGYEYYGATYTAKHDRTIFNAGAANYYDSTTPQSESVYIGGWLTDANQNQVKNKQGKAVLLKGSAFSFSTTGDISAITAFEEIGLYDLQGASKSGFYADGNAESLAWAKTKNHLAVLTSNGAGMMQFPANKEDGYVSMLTIYDKQGSEVDSIKVNKRIPLDHLTVGDPITWAVNDKYILYNRAYQKSGRTHRELWWLEVATGLRGQINTRLNIIGSNTDTLLQ